MKVLCIGNKPAYPKVDGGCVASAAFLNDLIHAGCSVHYAFLYTDKHPFKEDLFPSAFKEQVNIKARYVNTSVKKLDAFKHLFSAASFNVERFYSKQFETELVQLVKEQNFDTIIFDNVFSARYQSKLKEEFPQTPCFIRSHNVEFEIWESLADGTRNWIVRSYLKKLAKDLRRFEIAAYNHSQGVLTITEDDHEELKKLGVTSNIQHIPVSVTIPDYAHSYDQNGLFHLGAMNWRPNVEAVDTILKYLPVWVERNPNTHFTIAGIQSKERYDHLESESVTVEGFVEDITTFVQSQGILVAPIQSGSGVRIKILEMMALGVPIITTTLGAQGIADTSGVLIADDHESLAEAVYALRNDEKKRQELGQKAKSIITLHHNSVTISQKVLEFIKRK
ncbi:MAG: glycosyltransferase family 4 protein [bacterium]|nr:glycosyltransferase family 4 protein [bacterium]